MENNTKYLSVTEVSKRLNLSIQTIRKYIKTGKLPAKKTSKGLRYIYLVNETDVKILANQLNIEL